MPVPKRKRSRSRRDKRFATKGIKPKTLAKCKNCNEAVMPHTVCTDCGYYKGVKVLFTKTERAEKRRSQVKKSKTEQSAQLQQPAGEVQD